MVQVQSSKGVCFASDRKPILPVLTLALSALCLQWLRNPGPQHEKRTLFGDMVCFLFITPLATVSGWLCLRGAVDHLHFSSRLEAVGLIALTVALFTIYLFWTLVSIGDFIWLTGVRERANGKINRAECSRALHGELLLFASCADKCKLHLQKNSHFHTIPVPWNTRKCALG